MMVGRAVGKLIDEHTPSYPFERVQEYLTQPDLTFGNLECAVTTRNFATHKAYRLRADPRVVPALSEAGFDVMSLANNHTMDCGRLGLLETIATLRVAGIATVGAGKDSLEARKPVIMAIHGLKVAFLAFTDAPGGSPACLAWIDSARIVTSVRDAKKQADLVLVSFHWGEEYATAPLPYQKALAHAVIDAGAALVIGHHPHVIEGVERYKDGLIAYSLGNFVFDQHEERGKRGIALGCLFTKNGVARAVLAPYVIRENRPQAPEPWEAREIMLTVQRYSAVLGTGVEIREGLGWVE